MSRDRIVTPRLRPAGASAAYIAALAAIIVISRLPQLLGPNLLIDGDEAIVGLMARHVAQGRGFPIFFYGQHYGFSSVEAAAGALSFAMFGVGAMPLKAAMLLLWTAGVIFLFLACSARLGRARGFWTMAVFVLSPAWAVWSMKARGGYLTSFTAASALLWLLALDTARTEARWIAAGALTAVIYLAQPLWLPTVVPFAVAALWRDRQPSWAVSYVGMAMAPAMRT